MSGKKVEKKVGKGLNALISSEVISEEVKSDKEISATEKTEKLIPEKKEDAVGESINEVQPELIDEEAKSIAEAIAKKFVKSFDDLVSEAIKEANENPRVMLWSPKATFALRLLRKTEPEFSISEVAAEILEDGIKRRYPEIWSLAEKVEYKLIQRRRKRRS